MFSFFQHHAKYGLFSTEQINIRISRQIQQVISEKKHNGEWRELVFLLWIHLSNAPGD
jgi:hypothetical protein